MRSILKRPKAFIFIGLGLVSVILSQSAYADQHTGSMIRDAEQVTWSILHQIWSMVLTILFSDWIYWLASLSATFTYGWAYKKIGDTPEHSETFARQIREGRLTQGYHKALAGALDAIDKFLRRPEEKTHSGAAANAWNLGLLDFALAFSITYPFLSLLIQWTITGQAGTLGYLEIISGNTHWLTRLAIFFATTLSVLLILLNLKESRGNIKSLTGSLKRSTFVIAALFLAGGAFLFTSVETIVLSGFAVALVFAYALSGAAAVTVALIIAIGPNIVVAAVAVVFFILKDFLAKLTGRATLILTIYVIILYVILAMAVKTNAVDASQTKLLIMIGFLPILNAIFDFISIGFTRYQLRKALETGNFILRGLIDLIFGVLLFIALAFAILLAYSLLRTPDGGQLLNIAGILSQIRSNPENYSWLYITFASTLIPTFLHVMLVVTTWFFDIIPRYKDWLAGWVLKAGDAENRGLLYVVPAGFGVVGYIAVALPLSVFYFLYLVLQTFGLDMGGSLLTGVENLADFLGVTN